MTGERNRAERDAALWRRARAGWAEPGPAAEPADLMMLAAYLDGALSGPDQARLEAWLAGSPDGLDLLLAARLAQDPEATAVSESVLNRARALVRAPQPVDWSGRWLRSGAPGGLARWLQPVAWAGVAAALLLASVSGFELGRAGVRHLASLDAAVADDLRLLTGRSIEDIL